MEKVASSQMKSLIGCGPIGFVQLFKLDLTTMNIVNYIYNTKIYRVLESPVICLSCMKGNRGGYLYLIYTYYEEGVCVH